TGQAHRIQPGRHHRVGSTIRPPSPLRDRHPASGHVDRRRARLPLMRPHHDRDGQDRARQRPAIRTPALPELRPTRTRHHTTQEPHPHQERTVNDAAWLVVWLIHLLALFVIAATIIPPRGD